ncbi:integral membrane protein [Halenospora varia]|nr:integral membrane protein [Halenospora varia]
MAVDKQDSGIGKPSTNSPATQTAIVVFIAISLYNVVELNFIILATFKRRGGLYFWSFVISTWGIAIYSIGFLIKNLQISSQSSLYVTMIIVGWCSMVTGQSVVLYSRLHLVLRNTTQLRLVLGMIITNGVICHIPIIVMVYGANSDHPEKFLVPYSIYEKVQVTIFFLQELVISVLYIVQTIKILRPEGNIRGRTSRRLMSHLIYVNVIIVLLDITILGLEYSGLYDIQTTYKGLVYAVKLKLEFSILNRLVELSTAQKSSSNDHNGSGRHGVPMETFDGDGRTQRGGNKQGSRYRAHVYAGGVKDNSNGGVVHQEDVVVMTTEVVHRFEDSAHRERDNEQDLESVDAKSNVTTESTPESRADRVIPSSSSQIKFAKLGA